MLSSVKRKTSEAAKLRRTTLLEKIDTSTQVYETGYPPPGEYPQQDFYQHTAGWIRFLKVFSGGDARTPTKAARMIYADTAKRLALLTGITGFIIWALRLKKSKKKEVAKMVRLSEQTAQVRARCDKLIGQVVNLTKRADAGRGRLEDATEKAARAEEAFQETHELQLQKVTTGLEERSRKQLANSKKERELALAEAMVAIRAEVRLSEKADELARQVVRLTEQAKASRGSLEEATEKAARAEEALQNAQESLKATDQQAKRMEVVLGEERAKLAKDVQTKEQLKNLLGKETASKIAILKNRDAGLKSARTELEKARRDNRLLVEEKKKRAEAGRVAVNQAREMASAQHRRELEEQRTKLVKLRAALEERDRLLFVEKVRKDAEAETIRELSAAKLQELLQASSEREAKGAKNARANASLTKRVKVLEAELDGASEKLQSAEDAQGAAACSESAAVDNAKALKTKLGLANETIDKLKAERRKAKESGEGKGRVEDSPAKNVEPAPYFCCVAGCTVSRRGRYFHHGSGPEQLVCCPDCYVGLKGGKAVVVPGRLVLKDHLNRHDGDQDAESALSWRRETVPDCTGVQNPKNWCGLICVVQTLLKWGYFENEAIMAKREEEAKKGAPGPPQAQSKLSEAGPPQSGEKSKALLSLLGALLTSMRSAEQGAAPHIPDAIIKKLGITALRDHKQTDAAEILCKFLEITAGETGATQSGIGIGNEVEGKTRTKFQCDCGRVSEPAGEAFTVLVVPVSPLPVPWGKSKKMGQQIQGGGARSAAKRTLVDLFVEFFGENPLDRPCGVCKGGIAKTHKGTSTATLTKAPSKLFIQLDRVHYDSVAKRVCKVTDKVDIPLVLDLGPFMPGGKGNAVYDVDTTVHHLGETAASGHYTTYARVEGRVWCRFSDHKTATVGTDQALAEGVYLVSYTKRP